ncbi:histidine kinase [Pseudalgibacter alginicilyticus]|uniref:histidine kinase n=1 Tax=Pseudalgibacter alginicilyticus TaxID=1736674 RepID=A0A0P0D0K7_9FLAO|nr:ATP-binding protein [Pseudalgibacter alginicilyticus]ALJ06476.1 histidine kinase [Pseudalgibacter alginicilyticus]
MNSLLKRQVRKYLNTESMNPNMELFIDSVNKSYNNYDEHFAMLQRAMSISSEELFTANQKLQNEAKEQQEVIDKLKNVINTLKVYELPEGINANETELTGLHLVNFLDSQTKDIIEINAQREKVLQKLAEQNQELSDYAHMVSHDLKSPLRSIYTLTTWLKDDYKDKIDANGHESLDLIRNNVEKMDNLISGILDYTTINKNKSEFYDVDIDKLIDDILETIEIPNTISIKKASQLPVINGDKYRLQQLFQNMIDNAIKYNDKENGFIEIGFKNQTDFWEFYVKDNGKGIDAAYFEKIFKTFGKLENNSKSTGIGLSIVKKIIDIYGGKVWLESELGKGTTFYFTLKK